MAKEIFSIYVCTRWAPNSEFTQILDGEMATGQLPRKKASKLYRDGRFIPLRCSENFKVFSDASLGKTNFEVFEGQMQSLATWYAAEKDLNKQSVDCCGKTSSKWLETTWQRFVVQC